MAACRVPYFEAENLLLVVARIGLAEEEVVADMVAVAGNWTEDQHCRAAAAAGEGEAAAILVVAMGDAAAAAADEGHRLDCCNAGSTVAAGTVPRTSGDWVAGHDHATVLGFRTNCYYDQNGYFAMTKETTTMDATMFVRVATEYHHACSG